jgi:undecaprenyl-diphosphatase
MNFRKLLEWDWHYSQKLRVSEKSQWHRLGSLIAHSGDSWFWLVGLAAIWIFSDWDWHYRSTIIILGLIFLAALVLVLKFTIRRRRPEGEWGNIYRSTDPHSFPSGHASRIAYLAVMAVGLGPQWFAILVVLWAPIAALSRVIMGVHYLSDIIAGIFIGILFGFLTLAMTSLLYEWLPFLFVPVRVILQVI